MRKRTFLTILALLLVFGAIFGWKIISILHMKNKMAAQKEPPSTVTTAIAKGGIWQGEINAVGTARAIEGVEVSAADSGIIDNIYFKSGATVKAGEILLQQDSRVLRAVLQSDTAKYELAKLDYQRNFDIYQKNAISRSTLDSKLEALKVAEAAMNQTKAQIARTVISAPFDGKVGIRQVDVGQYITPGQNIVSLQKVDPILVDFNVPEKYAAKVKVGLDVTLIINSSKQTFKGKLIATDSSINKNTRSLAVRAAIPNPNADVLPGTFVSVSVELPSSSQIVSVPQTAIAYNPYGDYVYIVEKGIAKTRYVKVGELRGDEIAITEGIKAGEQVVTAGQLKLHDGAPVTIDTKLTL